MNSDYLKEYLKTCDTINEMILAKWPEAAGGGALAWVVKGSPELYKQEEKLDARINVIWQNAIDFEAFKKTVLDWGRTVLKIYKEYSESIEAGSMLSESAGLLGGSETTA